MNSNSNNGRAIIYLRKSTDREDRQQISIETQRQHCERLAKDNNFDTFTIEDHKSAKEEWKRPWFKQMLSLCKKWWYDYVIAYDPTRVSRNTIDAAYFTELINKNHIKGFYAAETRQFFNGTDIFSALMLGISFLMSKADNQMRSSNTRRKMETYFNDGRIMGTVPFWYKNHQFFDDFWILRHDVKVVERDAELIRIAFEMRKKGSHLVEIANFFAENWYPNKTKSSVECILKNVFYIWIQKWKFWQAEIKSPWYRPIITCKLFEEVQRMRRMLYCKKQVGYIASLKWMIYDDMNRALVAYEKTNRYWNKYIYYKIHSHSTLKLNLSEKKAFKKIDEYMNEYQFDYDAIFALEEMLKKEFLMWNETKTERWALQDELVKTEQERKTLTQKLIEGVISDDIYKEMTIWLLTKKKRLEEQIKWISDDNRSINTLIRNSVELLKKLYPIYIKANSPQKWILLRGIEVELFVRGDKSLAIKENKLLDLLKSCLFRYGSSTQNRTEVLGFGDRCSNRWTIELYPHSMWGCGTR